MGEKVVNRLIQAQIQIQKSSATINTKYLPIMDLNKFKNQSPMIQNKISSIL